MHNFLVKHQFKAPYVFIIFLLCSFINILGEGFHYDSLILISKPLLLFLLLIFFIQNTRKSKYKTAVNWIIAALISSNIGDILLLLAGRASANEQLFLAGLGAFLMTHIAYTFSFHKITASNKFKLPLVIVLVMLFFWIGFNYVFSNTLAGFLQAAVGLYSFVILVMVYFSWRLNKAFNNTLSNWILWGALLFLLSDTFVGLNKFGQDLITIPAVGVLIMSTYLAGQALIVLGIIRIVK